MLKYNNNSNNDDATPMNNFPSSDTTVTENRNNTDINIALCF